MSIADKGKTRIIVNPASAGGRAWKRVLKVKPLLDAACPHNDWCESRNASHLTELCHDAANQNYARVIVCGGDGSVHFAIRGLIGTSTALGILPVGTGNDFALAAGIPANKTEAVGVLMEDYRKTADLGMAGSIPFCCVAGVGMDTPALNYINASRMRRGRLLYQLAALKTLLQYKSPAITVITPHNTYSEQVLFAAFANTSTYAGGNPISPSASIFDGKLDYCLFADRPKPTRLLRFLQMKQGRHIGKEGVFSGIADTIRIESDMPVPLTLDGELTALTTPIEIRVLPAAIQLICKRET